MALGGGTFLAQNKVLPGAYINFISVATASANMSDRGFAAIGLELDWGQEGKIFEVTSGDFMKNSMKIFGYSYTDEKMKGLRDLFKNVRTLYAYRLNSGGKKATNTFADALYCGTRGNDIKIAVQKNDENNMLYDVQTWIDGILMDVQTVKTAKELVPNDYVSFKPGASLDVTAATALTGGSNGTSNTASHQAFLDKIESYPSINAIGYVGTDEATKKLYATFAKRMRDEIGVKFQAVVYNLAADYEGVINVKNKVAGDAGNESAIVYWVTGVVAGTAINASATNKIYDGEFIPNVDFTQSQLEAAIKAGEFTLHQVGSDIRVLNDINSLVTTSANKGNVFKDNQTIRVCDQIATDIANLFVTKYLGVVPNDASGRTSLWADIVKHHEQLQDIRAIEGFKDEDVTVAQGDTKKSVVVTDNITVVNTMEKLYMTVYVS